MIIKLDNISKDKAQTFLNKSFTGGSDAHILLKYGKVVTYANSSNVEDFLDSIAKKDNFVVGKEIGIIKRIVSYSNILNLIT